MKKENVTMVAQRGTLAAVYTYTKIGLYLGLRIRDMVIVRVRCKDNDNADYKMLQSFPNMWAMWEYGAKIIAPICDVCTAG